VNGPTPVWQARMELLLTILVSALTAALVSVSINWGAP
jgi:hypothetical protein